MPAYIHQIETVAPSNEYPQEVTRELIKKNVNSDRRAIQSIIHRVYTQSGIDKRHSVIDDFSADCKTPLFFDKDGITSQVPSTARRNQVYTEQAKKMFCDAAEAVVENSGFDKNEITHVITVSCTGFFAPGPEYFIVKHLGLPGTTQRFHIGFMGCFAAFPALKMAKAFCDSDPEAVVLIVALELCSIHLQFNADVDTILSGSVFADGGAGVLVSSKKSDDKPALQILDFKSNITDRGEQDMAWTIGDTGFDMVLTSYVPDIIEDNIRPMVGGVLGNYGFGNQDITHWAVHPGGRAIVDRIQKALSLNDEQVLPSREILRQYGNMSSATVLFVLNFMMNSGNLKKDEHILSMAFGPGLTVETGLLKVV